MFKTNFLFEAEDRASSPNLGIFPSLLTELLFPIAAVIPRHHCLHECFDLQGIPRWHWRSFAETQAKAKAAFARTNWAALVQEQQMHIWLWDAQLEDHYLVKGHSSPLRFIPSSLLGRKYADGVDWVYNHPTQKRAVEARLWKKSKLLDTQSFDQLPSLEEWRLWRHSLVGSTAQLWPERVRIPERPRLLTEQIWATPILPKTKKNPASINLQKIRAWSLGLASVALMVWLGQTLGQMHWFKNQIIGAKNDQSKKLSDFDKLADMRQKTERREQWVELASKNEAAHTAHDYLEATARLVQRLGLVLREYEMNTGVISATVVVPAGVNFRITSVVNALDSEPLFFDAKFVDVVAGDSFKFTWRLRSSGGQV